jgi:methionyl aminopeptidase
MSIETEADLAGMLRAGRVVAEALRRMEERMAVGVTTGDLDEVARQVIESHGARATPKHEVGFPASACISVNDEAVHGIPGSRVLRADDVVKIDVTADVGGSVADAARTIVVEPLSQDRLRLAWCAKSAFRKALGVATTAHRTDDIGSAVERETRSSGFKVIRSLCGHGVGRKMHEPPSVPNYRERASSTRLTHGLVITIEPIISGGNGEAYLDEDGWTVRTSDGAMAAHYEETVIITRTGPRIVTGDVSC